MEKICFVILHYNDLKTTENCIKSIIKNIEYDNYSIVVVDNASTNKSGLVLQKKFSDNALIHIILNDENLGFARGNNIGYDYARNKLCSDFIICINNDTLMTDKNFIKKMIEAEKKYKCGLMGPDIVSKNGMKQSPIRRKRLNIGEINERLFKKRLVLSYLYFKKYVCSIKKIEEIRLKDTTRRIKDIESIATNEIYEDCVLMGACIIFCPLFVQKEKYGFNPNTFMYGEEDLLSQYCYKKKYKVIFCPQIKIIHLGEVSTNSLKKDLADKEIFFCKNTIKGLKLLKKLITTR